MWRVAQSDRRAVSVGRLIEAESSGEPMEGVYMLNQRRLQESSSLNMPKIRRQLLSYFQAYLELCTSLKG